MINCIFIRPGIKFVFKKLMKVKINFYKKKQNLFKCLNLFFIEIYFKCLKRVLLVLERVAEGSNDRVATEKICLGS